MYCACDVSNLTPVQAVVGAVTCEWCGLPLVSISGPVVLAAADAADYAATLAAGGLVIWVAVLRAWVPIAAEHVVHAPGRAQIGRCDCGNGRDGGRICPDCDGTTYIVWHACPRCGDGAWQYDRDGSGRDRTFMSCRHCGHVWGEADPAWLAQRVPDRLLTVVAS